jgi:glucosamine--fructose-6-phosphate aminotransferase (isomerizing)
MCGIVGVVGSDESVELIFNALKRLEYRGYDSSGIATINNGKINCEKASGKLGSLEKKMKSNPLSGSCAIGHTRWATHGAATVENAHPHVSENIAIVHNGIVENFQAIKDSFKKKWPIKGDTDSEILLYFIQEVYEEIKDPLKTLQYVLKKIDGNYSVAVLFDTDPNTIYAAKRGSPLVIGKADRGCIAVASDSLAISHITNNVIYLEDGDISVISPGKIKILNRYGESVERPNKVLDVPLDSSEKGDYSHYMLKEIYEQPESVQRTPSYIRDHTYIDRDIDWAKISSITIIACGTSYYAGMVAKYWFEQNSRIPVNVDVASEFRYRSAVLDDSGIAIVISQSGETIDTLSALKMCKESGMETIGIINVDESSIARMVDHKIITQAGPEIGVASTKAFTTQLATLALLSLYAGKECGVLSKIAYQKNYQDLLACHDLLNIITHDMSAVEKVAEKLTNVQHALFVGRGLNYPMALEGALKLKEISYIHAEGYAAGELKHGPIALLDSNMPVIVLCPSDEWFAKTESNIHEILARGASVYVMTDAQGAEEFVAKNHERLHVIVLPNIPEFLGPICYSVPMQLLAYHTAKNRGNDIDQPRNLAKSVTVE